MLAFRSQFKSIKFVRGQEVELHQSFVFNAIKALPNTWKTKINFLTIISKINLSIRSRIVVLGKPPDEQLKD